MGTHAPEVEDVLSIINHPPSRLPGPNLLHLLVQSSSRHGQPAIDFLGPDGTSRSTSYAELHHASEALATRISASVGTQQALEPLVVPVLIPQSPELYIALLAILKAGGAFCPMNLDLPPERAKFILEDVSATVVITTSGLRSRLPPGNRSVLVVDDEAPAKAVPVVSAQHRLPTPSDLAYVMYTSGSTGTPKGVGVSHEAATQSLLAHDRHIPQFSRFLQFAAPTFDVSVFDIFFPLFRGRTLVGCTRSAMLNDLPAVIRRMDVDACELTPSVAGSLLRKRENAPGLRLLLTIGEMLTEPVVHEFGGSADRPSMLWGMYGPTEAAIHCTLQPAFTNSSAVQNIGIPLDTVSAFVLEALPDDKANSEFRVLPRGQVGELAVGGHQLAVGYLNRPEQTKSAFIDTPYGRLYRTGDKARMRPDGTLECLGRIVDGQVKLRGQRLELGEVEHAALRTPGCHGAVAAVTNAVLVLFCAVEGSGDMAAAVGESCKQWLPGFMLPNDIVVVESFPRLASGKVDRKGLVAEYRVRLSEGPRGTSDVDELEQRLCRLASTSLGLTVHPSQDLARAGLDSLSAIKLASVLRDAGFQVNALDLLGARTISSLRSLVDSAQETRVARATPEDVNSWSLDISNIMANHPLLGAPDEPVECIIPCTRLQTSMLAETAADPRAYCNWVELAFPRSDTEKTIRTWFLQLAQANEILRTGFIHHQGQFLQVIFKSLSRSAISTADCVRREFEMQDDHDFLRPFRVQVSTTPNGEATSVVLQLHHAVYDGWSLDLLFKDLARLTRGDQLVPRAQFSKIAAYHQSSKFTESCDAAREFWAGTLLGFRPPALPVLVQAIPTTPALLSSSIILDISPHHLKTALQRTGINCGPQTVFQAALAWLWSSMVGTEDVVIGSVTSGRTMPISNVEDIVGPCIAAVPLRTDLSQARTIKDLLVTIHAATRAALPHSALPLSEIKQVAGVPSGQPIYDVLFVYQESLHGRDPTAHTFQEVAHQDYLETKLLVEVEPGDKDFECRFSYHSDVFPEAQVRLMANLIRTLVLHTVENLDAEISLMRKAFPSRLLSIFDPTPGSFSGVPDLAQAVEGIVARFPDKEAVCFANSISDNAISTTTITFAELSETADRIASHLHQAGLREGGVVGIIMEKSVRLYAGILAILKAGCAYLPLLPSTPVPRIETIVQQAKPAFCLVDTATRDKLWDRLPCNMLDIQSLSLGETAPSRARAQPDPDRLAYVIYTSGSTGVPKGVCVTQLNIMSNLDVLSHIYPVKEGSRLLQSCSQAFDVSVFEIFFAWTQGICLCSGTNDTLFEDLENSIRKLNVTHLSMTPTVASLVDPANVPQVEFLVTAGEAMTESVAGKWGDKLYQGYGPSETTNICSVKRMGPDQAIRHLGWSLDNTSTFVLAKDSTEVVPLGCVGEFCFGGDQIARGYLNMDDLTSAKFITHPAFGRIYRSGDLGRMLSDGSMVILGRADEQIKLRGQRVELGEVTEAVKGSSNAADCATLLLCEEDTGLQDRLVCFLVPNRRQTVTSQFRVLDVDDDLKLEIQSLYHALSTRLPSYMVPSAVVPISTLPTTSSGKLDRARLRHAFIDLDKHLLASISQGAEFHAGDGQLSDVEMRVAEAVTSALGVKMDDVQKWTPLATLGLDSISAIQVSRHLHARVGPRCPISLILQNPSVARLSQVLSHMDPLPRQGETPDLLPKHVVAKVIERLDQEGKPFTKILPCTALQEAMLAASAGMSGQYLNRMLFRINGDLARLKEAWTAMCARHGILRTCFLPTDDAQWPIIQGVLDKWHLPWHDFDASRSTIEDCISQHARLVPDALDSLEPAISLATIKHDDRVFLSFVCHHALYDGVAVERLLYEVEQHVSGSAALPPAPAYDDFLRASLRLPASTDGFWLQHLAGYEPILAGDLRFDHLQTGVSMPFRELDLPLTQVKSRIRDLGVSLLALTQSAWAICLEILLRASDVCFGNVVNGRSLPIEGLNELVAPCFNTIPIRMDLSASPRNVDLMKAFQTLNTKLLQYQYTPLRRTQRLIAQHGNRRLFDTLLLLQQSPRPPDQSLWTLERDEGEMDVPVVCEVTPDTQIDRLTFKIHTTERQRLPPGVVSLILDVFSFAMHSCLRFPASRVHVDDVPQGLAERLSQLELRPPNSGHTTVTSRPDGSSDEWTPSENSIRAVLASLSSSDAERIQRDTAIYQLGLDSIGAVQVAAMLRQLGHQVLAGDVMEHPTCRSLAQYIDNPAADAGGITVYDVSAFQTQVEAQVLAQGVASDSFEAIVPCTPVQAAVMAQFIKSDGRDYFNYVGFELQDRASATSVLDAWQAVCHAHPILRTGIIPVEHADCAFTMVQYSSHTFTPALAIQSLESGETFDPKGWLTEACRVAVREPERRLWSVAIVQAEEAVSMHLAIHHALYDAHSLQLILDDVSRAARGDGIPRSMPLANAAADILGQVFAAAESSAGFWKEQSDKVVINRFPVMTPLRQSSRDVLTESIQSGVPFTALQEATSTSGHTLQVVLQAAWTRVLSAYLGEDSVVFGVTLSGRTTEATQRAVFPCLTTLPVIATNRDSNHELLARMMQYNTELHKQQHQPLTRIQQWLGHADSRLFDTLMVYQKLDLDSTSESRPWRIVDEASNVDYPVSIEVQPEGGHLRYAITFFSDVLAKEQAVTLLRQFDATVRHLALKPTGHEADLFTSHPELFSILPPAVPEIPATVHLLHQFVELQALKTPDSTALRFVDGFDGDTPLGRMWTYKELDTNGNRVAQTLVSHVQPGDIVAVYFDKCPEAYFSILGILKAGCAFIALDRGAPKLRNQFILEDSGASVLLTSKRGRDDMELTISVPVIIISEESMQAAPAGRPVVSRNLDPDDVCYCLYTSGTTGTPKGCEITHENAVQCMFAFQHIFKGHWQEDSKWLQFASLHFDVSVLEQYWSWSVGITLVAAPRDLILEDLAGAISRLDITHIDLTPSLARLLHPRDVPSLCRGVFITGGESLKQEILDAWGPEGVIYNFYGPTEATIGVTVYPRVPTTGRPCNIGRQFVNVGSYLLRPGTERPVLRGGVGELCVSGRLVGKGYLKRDDLTRERFPTLERFGERVYRTGDLVRVLHDGCFDFLGRADDQVKLRGQRLEVGEINHAIRKGLEAVTDVATLVVRNEAQQKDLLVSFIVADDEGRKGEPGSCLEIVESPEALELCRRARDACRSRLPGYMVPTYVLRLPFIPLSANNKAETKELRRFFSSLSHEKLLSLSSVDRSRQALGRTGRTVSEVLSAMLAVDESSITPSSSIFELGVDSVSVLRLSRALKKAGLAQASPSLIMQHPLIADLSHALDSEAQQSSSCSVSVAAAKQLVQACAHKHRSHVCKELDTSPDQIEYIAPCSPLQQGMIARSGTDSAYFNTFRFVLAPEVSTERLRAAYQKTFDALPILRTKFVRTTDGFVQVAMKHVHLAWSGMRLRPKESVEEAVRKSRELWVARNQGCLVQPAEAVLIEPDDPGARLLVLHIFHGLYDANSFGLILDHVASQYRALAGDDPGRNTAFQLTSGPSFLDALCCGPLQDFSHSRPFWVAHLDGARFQSVRTPSPKDMEEFSPDNAVVVSRHHQVALGHLQPLRTRLGVTQQALVQAAWVSVLGKHFSANPTIGIIVSGRAIELHDAENVVGPLFNTLPFRACVSGRDGEAAASWSSLIRQCHDFNTAVLAFQHVPLRDIQKWCSAGKPLFDTLFSFQQDGGKVAEDGGLWTVVDSNLNADYPLALEAVLGLDGSLHLLLVAQQDWDDSGKLSRMMDELEEAFDDMVKNPDHSLRSQGSNEGVIRGTTPNGDTANGHIVGPEPTPATFVWTEEAVTIRNEMAALADMDPGSVTETAPVFGLGLDSIDVIKLSARLKRRGIEIKTGELMKAQTMEAMVKLLQSRRDSAEMDRAERGSRRKEISEATSVLRAYVAEQGEVADGDIVLPTTPLQESMLVEMMESDFQLYFNHDILELAPSVDIDKLKAAWRTVIMGTPILRTRFVPIDSPRFPFAYCQVIGREPQCSMTDVSIDTVEELARASNTARLRACEGAGRSDLLQLGFASIGKQRYLVLSIAHALYDGWSLKLLHRDVEAAYEGTYSPQSLESYLGQLEDLLFSETRDAPAFWSGFLQDATPTMLSEDAAGPDQQHALHRAELASSLVDSEIASFCRANAVTLQTLGQACWAALLASRTGSLDVSFGVVLSCRDTEALEGLLFPTMNTVAVRSVLHGTISSWLRYMQDNMASLSLYQHFPLREAKKLAGTNGPLFNTLFIHQPEMPWSRHRGGDDVMKSVGGSSAVEYPVCVEVEMSRSSLIWRAACNGRYASQAETGRLLQDLDRILAHIVNKPEAGVLLFSEQEVSICGLSPVRLATPEDKSPTPAMGDSQAEESEAWSPVEQTIREVLAEVSGVPATVILKSNTIYHLGLDSITAIKAGALLRKKGIEMRIRDMLKAGSISDMARLARETRGRPPVVQDGVACRNDPRGNLKFAVPREVDLSAMLDGLGFDKSAIKDVLSASPMQVHMLSVWQNTDGEVFYPTFTYTLSGQVGIDTIDAAWKALVAETPILRTVFVPTTSRSVPILQLVLDPSALGRTWASADSTMWNSRETGTLSQPYNSLSAEKDGQDRWVLWFKIHHALYDAVSLPAIMARFVAHCRGDRIQEPARLALGWRSATAFALLSSEETRAKRKHFWTEYLSGVDFPGIMNSGPRDIDARVSIVKPGALQAVSGLLELCRARGVSLQALFFAAYAELLASEAAERGDTRPHTVVFGIYLANRGEASEPGADVHPFLRLVPLRVVLQNRASLLDVAADIQGDIHAISSPVNVDVGLWEIKDWTGITLDAFLNFLGPPASHGTEGGVRLEQREELTAASLLAPTGSGNEGGDSRASLASETLGNPVRDAFPDSIDIEVSVHDNDMTVGVFGPGTRLDDHGALRIIDGVAAILRRVSDQGCGTCV